MSWGRLPRRSGEQGPSQSSQVGEQRSPAPTAPRVVGRAAHRTGEAAPRKGMFLNWGLSALQQKIRVTEGSAAGGEADAVRPESRQAGTRCKPEEAEPTLKHYHTDC